MVGFLGVKLKQAGLPVFTLGGVVVGGARHPHLDAVDLTSR